MYEIDRFEVLMNTFPFHGLFAHWTGDALIQIYTYYYLHVPPLPRLPCV